MYIYCFLDKGVSIVSMFFALKYHLIQFTRHLQCDRGKIIAIVYLYITRAVQIHKHYHKGFVIVLISFFCPFLFSLNSLHT